MGLPHRCGYGPSKFLDKIKVVDTVLVPVGIYCTDTYIDIETLMFHTGLNIGLETNKKKLFFFFFFFLVLQFLNFFFFLRQNGNLLVLLVFLVYNEQLSFLFFILCFFFSFN